VLAGFYESDAQNIRKGIDLLRSLTTMPDLKTSIPAAARAADSAGENCELTESAPAADASTPRIDAIAGKHLTVHSLSGYWNQPDRWVKYDDVCAILSHAGDIERDLRVSNARMQELEAQHEADCATIAKQALELANARKREATIERDFLAFLRWFEKQFNYNNNSEIGKEHNTAVELALAKADLAMTKQAAKIAELENNERAYERIVGRKTYREAAEEIAQLTERLAAAEKAIIAMSDDGWLYYGVEGMTEPQKLCYQAYLVARGLKNG
jgi:hypothetical protein